jgi:hypothetical protein
MAAEKPPRPSIVVRGRDVHHEKFAGWLGARVGVPASTLRRIESPEPPVIADEEGIKRLIDGMVAAPQPRPPKEPADLTRGDRDATPHPRGSGDQPTAPHRVDWGLLAVGLALLLLPVAVAAVRPDVFDRAQVFVRIIAALGGALVGSGVPGVININFPGIKAVGAIAVFALIYTVNPANHAADIGKQPAAAPAPETSSTQRLRDWVFPTRDIAGDRIPDKQRMGSLDQWIALNNSGAPIPVEVFIDGAAYEAARQKAIRDLHVE